MALPFACQQGGWLLFVCGLVGIGAWNTYSIQRLILCLQLIPSDEDYETEIHIDGIRFESKTFLSRRNELERIQQQQLSPSTSSAAPFSIPPPHNTSTLGRVAWYAFGRAGLQCLDISMLFLLFGIIVAYVAGSISFLADTPLSLGSLLDGFLAASIMATISMVPHLGHLSWVSATGLLILFGTFVVLAGYGILQTLLVEDESSNQHQQYSHHPHHHEPSSPSSTLFSFLPASIPLLPTSISGVSHWFGIVVFSFGVAPLTYNFQCSMKQPERMMQATTIAVSVTTAVYILLGMGMLLLYPHLTGDILHELPYNKGVVPVATRLAMVGVCILTAPLLVVPCSELVESKWNIAASHKHHRTLVRFGICWASVLVAVVMPGFVQVLALVGCLCVGWVGFCLPPLFHLRLSALAAGDYVSHQTTAWVVDTVLLTWGVAATVLSTAYTFQRVRHD